MKKDPKTNAIQELSINDVISIRNTWGNVAALKKPIGDANEFAQNKQKYENITSQVVTAARQKGVDFNQELNPALLSQITDGTFDPRTIIVAISTLDNWTEFLPESEYVLPVQQVEAIMKTWTMRKDEIGQYQKVFKEVFQRAKTVRGNNPILTKTFESAIGDIRQADVQTNLTEDEKRKITDFEVLERYDQLVYQALNRAKTKGSPQVEMSPAEFYAYRTIEFIASYGKIDPSRELDLQRWLTRTTKIAEIKKLIKIEEKNVKKVTSRLNDLSKLQESISTNYKNLEQQIEQQRKIIEQLQNGNAAQQANLPQAQAKLKDLADQGTQLGEEMKRITKEIMEIENYRQAVQAKINNLYSKMQQLQ